MTQLDKSVLGCVVGFISFSRKWLGKKPTAKYKICCLKTDFGSCFANSSAEEILFVNFAIRTHTELSPYRLSQFGGKICDITRFKIETESVNIFPQNVAKLFVLRRLYKTEMGNVT